MNDNDIIKALEYCTSNAGSCDGCPAHQHIAAIECLECVIRLALDLINRQKSEIERLKTELSRSIGIDDTKQNGCFPFD